MHADCERAAKCATLPGLRECVPKSPVERLGSTGAKFSQKKKR